MNDILNQLSEMKEGDSLLSAMTELPPHSENIRFHSASDRLMALSDIYDIYIPSSMSVEIYSKLYLALLRSLHKKRSHNAHIQRNINHKYICRKECGGILGGSDSFTITGCSGIGKSTAITKAIDLITAKGIIRIEKPYTKIIPFVIVQCPFDCSVKGLLIEILRKVDEAIGSDYYTKVIKSKATTDMLIGCVSQVSLNHIGLLVVDEIQNVVNSKNGKSLVGMLTQLINNSGISICMVGTPESTAFFEQAMQLARRSLGLHYSVLEYDQYFYDFCKTLYSYQYTKFTAKLTDSAIRWLYEHSGGILSVVVSLIHDAQEIAILNGTEIMNMEALNEAYQKRLTMLHGYIEPSVTRKNKTSARDKKHNSKETEEAITDTKPLINDSETLIADTVRKSAEKDVDIITLLKKNITVEVINL